MRLKRGILLAAIAVLAMPLASAQAWWRVGIGIGFPVYRPYPYRVYVGPPPVYVAPAYVQPAPVYVQPAPVYVQPTPVPASPTPAGSQGPTLPPQPLPAPQLLPAPRPAPGQS
jgi:hypothetical protein